MHPLLPFNPPEASTFAGTTDIIFEVEAAIALFIVVLIFGLMIYFAIRYRRRDGNLYPAYLKTHLGLEATWTTITFLVFTFYFFLGAGLYVEMKEPPKHAENVYVVGKQWMWKIQHDDGPHEINELHVPVGRTIKLIITSEDVIHSFYIPAFRIKQDAVPGTYSTEWFVATRPGVYHLYCSEYCGTDHSLMRGKVVVLEPDAYNAWRASLPASESPEAQGKTLFTRYGCDQCHGQLAPTLAGLYMNKVKLRDGSTVIADEPYIRRSILHASEQVVAGYSPVMPSFDNQLTPMQVNALVAYIKSLGPTHPPPGTSAPTTRSHPEVLYHVPNVPPTASPPPVNPPIHKFR